MHSIYRLRLIELTILYYRSPWVRLVCSCKERCADKNKFLCSNGVNQRKRCKFCRFERCQTRAGMERKWVVSGYKPTVENYSKRSSRTPK